LQSAEADDGDDGDDDDDENPTAACDANPNLACCNIVKDALVTCEAAFGGDGDDGDDDGPDPSTLCTSQCASKLRSAESQLLR